MTKELVCIVCPRSCRMTITSDGDELVVTGNTCKRGKEFAVSEMTDPRRTVCTTVRTAFPSVSPFQNDSDERKSLYRIFSISAWI